METGEKRNTKKENGKGEKKRVSSNQNMKDVKKSNKENSSSHLKLPCGEELSPKNTEAHYFWTEKEQDDKTNCDKAAFFNNHMYSYDSDAEVLETEKIVKAMIFGMVYPSSSNSDESSNETTLSNEERTKNKKKKVLTHKG